MFTKQYTSSNDTDDVMNTKCIMNYFSTKVQQILQQYDRTRNPISNEHHTDANRLLGGVASSQASRCARCSEV